MRCSSVVIVSFLAASLAPIGCSVTGSDSDDGGASGEAGSAGSDAGGSAGSATGGSAGSATGGSAGNATGGSAGNATGGKSGSSGASGLAGRATGGSAGSGGSGALCEDFTDGAFVDFEIVKETLRVWIENPAFIAEAERLLAAGETRVPVFNTLVDGAGCDPQWSWHPDPSDVDFADFTIELCDAVPSYIEENKAEWFESVGSWCPWSARVTAVTER